LSYYLLGLARVGKKEGTLQIEGSVFWWVSSSSFSLRLFQGVSRGLIYSLASSSGVWKLYSWRPSYWLGSARRAHMLLEILWFGGLPDEILL
jgi:hypothetical protein